MQLVIFVIILLLCIFYSQNYKKEKFNRQVKEMDDFKVKCAKNGNRRLLKDTGEEKFRLIYGADQLELIKNNQDVKLVELLEDWEDRLRKGWGTYGI